jgi:hypothetical protein
MFTARPHTKFLTVPIFTPDREDFRVPHAGVQRDHYESVHIFVLVLRCRIEQSRALVICKINDASILFLEASNLCTLCPDPLPLQCLVEKVG